MSQNKTQEAILRQVDEVLETLRATRSNVVSMIVDEEEDNTKVFNTIRMISKEDSELAIQKLQSIRELVHKEFVGDGSHPEANFPETKHVVQDTFLINGREVPKEEFDTSLLKHTGQIIS